MAGTDSEDTSTDASALAEGNVVAKIVVTSDSIEFLENLEIVSLDVDKED